MSAVDDFIARKKAGAAAPGDPRRAFLDQGPQGYDNYLDGALQSFSSAIPEMVGFDASPAAAEFRHRNPVSGFISQAIPYVVGGVGSEALAGTRAAAGGIEAVLGSLGLGVEQAATRPVLRNAVKYGVLGQAPFEVGRAALGTAIAPEDNIGDLWASSALGLAMGGVATGGLSLLLKSGGAKIGKKAAGELLGGDMELSPTYAMRQGKELGPEKAKWANGTHDENMDYLMKQGIEEEPVLNPDIKEAGWRNYTGDMQGNVDEQGWKDLNGLFKINREAKKGLDVRSWYEGSATDATKLVPGEREGLLKAAGFDDLQDLASTVRYPRVVTVADEAGAEHMNNLLSKTGGLDHVDGSWIGYNKDDVGVFAKRISHGEKVGEKAPKGFGRQEIKAGDKFLVGLTDKTGRLAPNAEKFADRVLGRNAMVSRAWKQGVKNDIFAKHDDKILQLYGSEALDDATKLTPEKWIEKHAKPIGEKIFGKDFAVGEQADWLYRQALDAVAPTLAKLPKNKLYARLYGLMKGRDAFKNSRLMEMVHGKIEGWEKGGVFGKKPIHSDMGLYGVRNMRATLDDLTDEESHYLQSAADNFVKPEELKDFVPDEVYSAKLQKAADERVVDDKGFVKDFVPTFEKGDAARFNFEEGYMLPSMVQGPFQAKIFAEGGKHPIWNVAGNSAKEVNEKVAAIVGEAKARGKLWEGENARISVMDKPDQVQDLMERLQQQLANKSNADVLKTVQKAMGNYNADKYRSLLKSPRKGGSALSKRGTAKMAATEGTYSKGDILKSFEQHRKDLLSFQADYGMRQRYAGPLAQLKHSDEIMYKDLQHKMGQFAGMQGPTSRFINEKVSGLLGPSLGPNAATTIANTTNKMMYLWNLGILNPTAAVVNMLTPITVLPSLIARIARMDPQQFRNLVQVAPRINAEGKVFGVNHLLDPIKVTSKSTRDWINPTPEAMEHVTRAVQEGALSAQLVDESLGTKSVMGATMGDIYKAKGLWHAAEHGLTWMSRRSEEFSKGVMFMAGRNIGQMMGLEGEALYQASVSMMEMGAYGYKQTQRAKAITGPIGSVMGLFKNFQMHFINDMLTYVNMGVKGEGWSPFLWQQASALSIGGLGVTPLVHLADGMAAWSDGSPTSYAWMKKNWAGTGDDDKSSAANNVYYGLGGVLGVSLTSSLMMPGTDVANDVASFGNIVLVERMKALGKVVGDGWNYAESTGQNPLDNDSIRDAVYNASMPRAVIRAMAVTEGDFVKTMKTGNPAQRGLGLGDRVAYGLGITPVDIASHQLIQTQAWKKDQARHEMISNYGQRLADARLNGDVEEQTQIMHDALWDKVPLESVFSSSNTIYNRHKFGDNLSRYDRQVVRDLEGE